MINMIKKKSTMSNVRSIVCVLLPLAALLPGCTSESLPEVPKSTEPVALTESAQIRGIRSYLDRTRKGTRAGDYQLIPYVEEGDTMTTAMK